MPYVYAELCLMYQKMKDVLLLLYANHGFDSFQTPVWEVDKGEGVSLIDAFHG